MKCITKQKNMWLLITVILTLLLSLSFTTATRVTPFFDMKIDVIDNEIYAGEAASFNLSIENKQDFEEIFFFSMPDIRWSPQTTPIYFFTSGMDIDPVTNESATLYVKSHAGIKPGKYFVQLILKSEVTGKKLAKVVTINVLEKPLVFDNNVSMIVDFPKKVEVDKLYSSKVSITNNNLKNFSDVSVKLDSNLVSTETNFPLAPHESKTIEFTFKLPEDTTSQIDTVTTTFSYDEETLLTQQNQFEVIEKEYPIEESKQDKKGFFSKATYIRLYNPNKKDMMFSAHYEQTSPSLFTSYNYLPNLAQKGNVIGWKLVVPAQSEKIIEIKQNYSIIFYLVILLLIAVGTVLYTRSPVEIKKKIMSSHFDRDSIYKVKIQLTIKNRLTKPFENVSITDVLPYLGSIEKQQTIGIIPPDKIIRYNEETYLKWKLDLLEAKEERILAYTMNLKLSIIGSFILKPALVKINNKSYTSNKITINDGAR